MVYSVEEFANGTASVRNSDVGETMHSSIGANAEAEIIYVGQSDLERRLFRESNSALVVYDIGLGIAANSLALTAAVEKLGKTRTLSRDIHIISFENDLEGLRFALDHSDQFSIYNGQSSLIHSLRDCFLGSSSHPRPIECTLKCGARLKWELCVGDFRDEVLKNRPRPDVIYFDFYSPKSSPDLWTWSIFKRLYDLCHRGEGDPGLQPGVGPRRTEGRGPNPVPTLGHPGLQARVDPSSTLITYSSSTAVRSALILAGFYVGYGVQTAAKFETTIASTCRDSITSPLGQSWIQHLKRSGRPLPLDFSFRSRDLAIEEIERRVLS